MSASVFLLLNLALAFYNVGTIWAHEIDIFRTWKLIGRAEFHQVQKVHFHKIPYRIFAPVGLALLGNIALTAAFWGRWQGRLAQDERGPESPYLAKILRTHWVRTALINGYALVFLFWTAKVLG